MKLHEIKEEIKIILYPKHPTSSGNTFFITLGIIITTLSLVTSLLIPSWHTKIFTTLITDHMPLKTIMCFSLILCGLFLADFGLSPTNTMLKRLIYGLTVRIHQLTTPLIMLLIGVAIALNVASLLFPILSGISFMRAIEFTMYIATPYLYIIISNLGCWWVSKRNSTHIYKSLERHPVRQLIYLCFTLSFPLYLFLFSFSHQSTVNIQFTINADEYSRLQKLAQAQKVSPEAWLKKQALQPLQR